MTTSPTEQLRYDYLVEILVARSHTRAEYRQYCRLVAILTAALPRARVAEAYAAAGKAA